MRTVIFSFRLPFTTFSEADFMAALATCPTGKAALTAAGADNTMHRFAAE